jgi:hypothetical protein
MGDGPFLDGPMADELALRVDPNNANHGLVEPAAAMTLSEYQLALAATGNSWNVIAEDVP